jgi:copper(I)-binding protein
MLFELAGPLALGDTLELTLVFAQAGEFLLAVPVEDRR